MFLYDLLWVAVHVRVVVGMTSIDKWDVFVIMGYPDFIPFLSRAGEQRI